MNIEIHNDMRTLRGMVKDLLDLESGLSDWEINFLDSLNHWEGDYTENQVAKLQAIYKRVLG